MFTALEPLILMVCPMKIISNMKKSAFFFPMSICVIVKGASFGVKFRFDVSLTLSFAICTMGIIAIS